MAKRYGCRPSDFFEEMAPVEALLMDMSVYSWSLGERAKDQYNEWIHRPKQEG